MKNHEPEEHLREQLQRRALKDIQYEDPLAFFRGLKNALFVMAAFVSGGWLLYRLLREVL